MSIKLLTIGEVKRLAAAIPGQLDDTTPVKIEVTKDFVKLKHFFSEVLIVRINTYEQHPFIHR